ncbi:formin-binding protein 4-like [Rhopilema esculentum]|uniref:formin-binding protein 4-like n=1 Tax=Rhopilema esculentum TaxID=499914 RepID=UPI0031DC7817
MGKRSKEKRLAETAGRRRQTIQLDGLTRRAGPAYNGEESYSQPMSLRATRVSGIGLLGAYTEESDNESDTEGQLNMPEQNAVLSDSKRTGHQMEDQLAGFLAEINAIGDDNITKPAETTANNVVYDPCNFDPHTQAHLLPTSWQAVYDESSGYHYYWNSETNEVQWEPPPATEVQQGPLPEPLPSSLNVESSQKINDNEGSADEMQPAGPSLEEFEANEEARRRKEMAAKLAGLSKKERIKLLLQKNNLSLGENVDETSPMEGGAPGCETENSCDSAAVNTTESGQVTNEEPKQDTVASLVLGYDSEASDSETMPDSKEIADSNLASESSMQIENAGNVQSAVAENVKTIQTLIEEKNTAINIPACDNFSKAETALVGEAKGPSDVNGKDALAMEVGSPINAENDSQGNDSNAKEDLVITSEYGLDENIANQEDVEMTPKIENVSTEVENAQSNQNKESFDGREKENADILSPSDGNRGSIDHDIEKKEFSVDIFAEESGNEAENVQEEESQKQKSEVDKESKNEGLKEGLPLEISGNDDGISKMDEGKKAVSEEKEKETNKEKEKEKVKEKERKSKSKDRKKDKKKDKDRKDKEKKDKEKKEKRHKEERSHRESDRKRKQEKGEKKSSKKHPSKSSGSSRHSRRSKEEETKPKKELTDEEKAKLAEEDRKALQEEIEREERLRSEYERLKKEEKVKKEEEQKKMELEKKRLEELRKEEEKRKEEEIADFAEMLLEGALDGETNVSEPKEDNVPENVDDMEISDNETEDSRPPLPPMPPPEDEPPFQTEVRPNDHEVDDDFYKQQEAMHSKISDLSILLFDKLEFLEVSRKGLTNFQVLLIEMETRMNDWREGALDSEYLVYKLEQIDAEICKYEETAAPDGWSCHWSSEYGMYYYYNEETGESTWSYPASTAQDTGAGHGKNALAYSAATSESPPAPTAPSAAPLENYGYGRTNMMMWRSDLIENEKKEEAKAITEKLEGKVADPYRDPYRSSSKKPEAALPPSPVPTASTDPPLPPGEDEDSFANPWEDGNRSGTSSPLPQSLPVPASQPVPSTTRSLVPAELMKSGDAGYIVAATTVKAAAQLSSMPRVASDSALLVSHSLQAHQIASQVSTNISQVKQEKKKKEKRKKLASGSLPSKKLKTVSSLVQKWQQVKQKADEEMMEESSEDEDPERAALKRIEEWKRAQIDSGRASYNPNFEEIKGNWREKIRKK